MLRSEVFPGAASLPAMRGRWGGPVRPPAPRELVQLLDHPHRAEGIQCTLHDVWVFGQFEGPFDALAIGQTVEPAVGVIRREDDLDIQGYKFRRVVNDG